MTLRQSAIRLQVFFSLWLLLGFSIAAVDIFVFGNPRPPDPWRVVVATVAYFYVAVALITGGSGALFMPFIILFRCPNCGRFINLGKFPGSDPDTFGEARIFQKRCPRCGAPGNGGGDKIDSPSS